MPDMPENSPPKLSGKSDFKRLTSIQFTLLAGLFLIGAFLRFHQIGKENMWMDEVTTVEYSMGRDAAHAKLPLGVIQHQQVDLISLNGAAPWWEIWTHLNISSYAPLYHIILRCWMDVFGSGTGSVRSLSAVFSLLILPVFYDICRRMFKPVPTFLATVLMTISIGQIGYAQEARGYSMLMFVTLCAADVVLMLESSGASKLKIAMLIVLLLAAELTQYFAAGAMLGLAIYVAIKFRGKNRRYTLAAFPIAAILFAILWGPQLLAQQRAHADFGQAFSAGQNISAISSVLALPVKFLIGEERRFFGNLNTNALLAIGIFIFAYPLISLWFWKNAECVFWELWTWGTILTIAALDWVGQTGLLQAPRYITLASPGICALAACCQLPTRRAMVRYIPAVAIIIFVLPFTIRWMKEGFFDAGDMHAMAQMIDSNVPPKGLVVFYSDSKQVTPGAWYLGWRYYSPNSQRDWLALMSPAEPQTLVQFGKYDSIWGVGKSDESDWQDVIPGWHPESREICSAGSIVRLVQN
jgi:uncharacterized membrane protein